MIILCLVSKHFHPFFDQLDYFTHVGLCNPWEKGAVACDLHHGVQITFRLIVSDCNQQLEEVVTFSLVRLAEYLITEKELLELCFSLCHCQVVVYCESQAQCDHSGAVLDDHLENAFCKLPYLHVIADAESNGANGRRGVANDWLNPVHAIDETLLNSEKEERECI